ncbi:ABC transporter ATP-binding protein [Siphonobacter sp. SORGH_AS_0500]|uniref:ABC transporter ATP-binding protein n=1 Tax=Siphonobacter sp. SORGH_AS_0500 TaxID=1864824 RepID=UPI00285EDD33|nr:ABC transporter ATP-binding protein [Siphonobacter sp. SORGH_AS_0500]MDR6194468.1 ABC-type multidrug transport system ATPase subunit [Siphonobacter sp. SORGH_AS_0500]
MVILQTQQLEFYFRKDQPIVRSIDLQVPQGSIFGFLGPNGAGKTTSIRLILGLLQAKSGTVEIFGQELGSNRSALFQKIGSLIESPSLYLHLTGKQNLEIARHYTQKPASRINEVLAMVGLEHAATKKAGAYSLGMKQRLGLAMALLHQPELVILDEPTNGLDPGGIIEMRELIKQLNRDLGITFFVSSHLLAEVERMCTHVGIIHQGNLLFQGSIQELQTAQAQQRMIYIDTNNHEQAQSILSELKPQLVAGKLTVPFESKAQVAALNHSLVTAGIDVYELNIQGADLEEMFLNITR